jgi:hypothetical protein
LAADARLQHILSSLYTGALTHATRLRHDESGEPGGGVRNRQVIPRVAPHEYFPGRLYLEGRIPGMPGGDLLRLGPEIHWWDN